MFVIQAAFKVWQERITCRALRSISDLVGSETFVLRDGHGRKIPSAELVPGDLVKASLCSMTSMLTLVDVLIGLPLDHYGSKNPCRHAPGTGFLRPKF